MFNSEVFEIMQDAFRQEHPKFMWPRKNLRDASPEFKAAVGAATIRINEVLKEEKIAATNRENQLHKIRLDSKDSQIKDLEQMGNWMFNTIMFLIVLIVGILAVTYKLFIQ